MIYSILTILIIVWFGWPLLIWHGWDGVLAVVIWFVINVIVSKTGEYLDNKKD